jgi:predicted DNA-binding transcriptional regulator AlpA
MIDDKRVLSIREFCHCYGIGRTTAYSEMTAGRLVSCQAGRRRLIRVDDAEAWSMSTRRPPSLTPVSNRVTK